MLLLLLVVHLEHFNGLVVMTNVYQNGAALLAHLNNPKLDEYLKGHEEMGDGLEVEIYGALAEDTIQFLNDSGIPWTHHSTGFGFFEDFDPRKIL